MPALLVMFYASSLKCFMCSDGGGGDGGGIGVGGGGGKRGRRPI